MEIMFLAIAIIIVALVAVVTGVRTVPQGQIWTVERFGRFTRTMDPGLHIIVPLVDRVGHRIVIQETVLDIPEQAVITKDNAAVLVDGIVYYRVMDVVKAAYQVAGLANALEALAMTNLRSVIGSMTFDETLSKREEISLQLMTVLDAATDPWGVKVTRVELRDEFADDGRTPPPRRGGRSRGPARGRRARSARPQGGRRSRRPGA